MEILTKILFFLLFCTFTVYAGLFGNTPGFFGLLGSSPQSQNQQALCNSRLSDTEESNNLPKCSFSPEELVRGRAIAGTTYQPTPFPSWINLNLAKQGQAFGRKNRFSVAIGALNGLIAGLAFPDAVEVLSFTSSSDSPVKALKRYAATTAQMFVWYDAVLSTDLNDNAFLTSISSVRALHINAANRARAQPKPLNDPNKYANIPTDDEMWEAFASDLQMSPRYKIHREFPADYLAYNSKATFVNQFIQGLTLAGLMSFTVMYPGSCYLNDATDDELRSFIHLWAVIGYVVGIDDEYNICLRATVQDAKDYFLDCQNKYLVPGLFQIDKKGKVLIESFIDGFYANDTIPGQTRRTTMLRLLRDFLDVSAPNMKAILSTSDSAAMRAWDNVFTPSTRLPFTRLTLNKAISTQIQALVGMTFGKFFTNMDIAEHVFFSS